MGPAVVLIPIAGQDVALGFQPKEKRRALVWRKDIEGRILDPAGLEELDGFSENFRGVLVEPENDPGLDGDVMCVNPLHNAGIVFDPVEAFANPIPARLGDLLQAEGQLHASAASSGVQELIVPANGDAGPAAPPLATWGYGTEQLLRILAIRGDVVVPEDDPLLERGIFSRNFGHGPAAQAMAVHNGDGAEIAAVRAAAGGEQNAVGLVAAVVQHLERNGTFFQGQCVCPRATWGKSELPLPQHALYPFKLAGHELRQE